MCQPCSSLQSGWLVSFEGALSLGFLGKPRDTPPFWGSPQEDTQCSPPLRVCLSSPNRPRIDGLRAAFWGSKQLKDRALDTNNMARVLAAGEAPATPLTQAPHPLFVGGAPPLLLLLLFLISLSIYIYIYTQVCSYVVPLYISTLCCVTYLCLKFAIQALLPSLFVTSSLCVKA